MTKLEEKLVELGYQHKQTYKSETYYIKKYNEANGIIISLYLENGIIQRDFCQVEMPDAYAFNSQQVIDTIYKIITQAFNQLQQDLEVLREYESLGSFTRQKKTN